MRAFEEFRQEGGDGSGLRAEDLYRIAIEFAGRISQAVCGPIDPTALGAGIRAIEAGIAYTDRILRRYRPELYAERGPQIIERLVYGYPSHGFVIDREELAELGVPCRAPTADEALALDRLMDALLESGEDRVIDIVPFKGEAAAVEEAVVEREVRLPVAVAA